MSMNVVNHWIWEQVFDGHASFHKKSDFSGADIVVNQLLDDSDIHLQSNLVSPKKNVVSMANTYSMLVQYIMR